MKTAIATTARRPGLRLPPRSRAGENRYVERLEPFIQKTMQEAKVPGLAVGIVEAGRPACNCGFGVMDARSCPARDRGDALPHGLGHQAPLAMSVMQLAERAGWTSMPPSRGISLTSS